MLRKAKSGSMPAQPSASKGNSRPIQCLYRKPGIKSKLCRRYGTVLAREMQISDDSDTTCGYQILQPQGKCRYEGIHKDSEMYIVFIKDCVPNRNWIHMMIVASDWRDGLMSQWRRACNKDARVPRGSCHLSTTRTYRERELFSIPCRLNNKNKSILAWYARLSSLVVHLQGRN